MGNTGSKDSPADDTKLLSDAEKVPDFMKKRASIASKSGGKRAILNTAQRQIVKGCLDNAREDFSDRVHRRIFEKREDFRIFFASIPTEDKVYLYTMLFNFLRSAIDKMSDSDEVRRLSEELGSNYLKFRVFGFKNDFFVEIADAITTECVLLDGSTHPASETLAAWLAITSIIFSSVRDGYHNEQRKLRKVRINSNFALDQRCSDAGIDIDDGNEANDKQEDGSERQVKMEVDDVGWQADEKSSVESNAELVVPCIGSSGSILADYSPKKDSRSNSQSFIGASSDPFVEVIEETAIEWAIVDKVQVKDVEVPCDENDNGDVGKEDCTITQPLVIS